MDTHVEGPFERPTTVTAPERTQEAPAVDDGRRDAGKKVENVVAATFPGHSKVGGEDGLNWFGA